MPQFDRHAESGDRKHAAALHSRGHRGPCHLSDRAPTRLAIEPVLLAIETAGSACSAAVVRDGEVRMAESRALRHGHAEALFPMIDRVMKAAGLAPAQLDAVAVATGPGGFTGIRVGLAAAHGIALAVGARLIGISSFRAVSARTASNGAVQWERLLVALDSRRADLYVQLFGRDVGSPLGAPQAVLADRLSDYLVQFPGGFETTGLRVAGDAAETAAAALDGRIRCEIALDSAPDARGVAAAALLELRSGATVGPVQPLYLRPPDVTLPTRPLTASSQ